MIVYLSVEQVLDMHRDLVRTFGGVLAVRDRGLLDSAVHRPAMTFGGEDLYGDLAAKAASLMHSLVLNHPFVDGNSASVRRPPSSSSSATAASPRRATTTSRR